MRQLTKEEVSSYIESSLGASFLDLELTQEDLDVIIKQALDKVAPYYDGRRYVQTSGNIIDLSLHHPLVVTRVFKTNNENLLSVQEYAFGGQGIYLFNASSMDRLKSYLAYKMLYTELQYQVDANFRYIEPNLYLDGYDGDVLIEMIVRPTDITDIDSDCMYFSWVKDYCLALAKGIVGRVRSKYTVQGSPYTLDGPTLLAESAQEKATLESQLTGDIFVL